MMNHRLLNHLHHQPLLNQFIQVKHHKVRSCCFPLSCIYTYTYTYIHTGDTVVQFSQEEYMVDETAGYVSLKVIIIGQRYLPISFKYKVFVSNTEFQPYPGLYVYKCTAFGVPYCTSYTTIVVYSRDHKGVGVAHEITLPKKTASIFPDNDEAVSVK